MKAESLMEIKNRLLREKKLLEDQLKECNNCLAILEDKLKLYEEKKNE